MRTIEIDFDVHKIIEAERQDFSETPNDVLRRLLGGHPEQSTMKSTDPTNNRPWSGKGVTLPHGTELRMEHSGRRHYAEIENGQWLAEGKYYKSPSAAAIGVARTRDGRSISLNGWNYWYAKRPGDEGWVSIQKLRALIEQENA